MLDSFPGTEYLAKLGFSIFLTPSLHSPRLDLGIYEEYDKTQFLNCNAVPRTSVRFVGPISNARTWLVTALGVG
jgi:hypothetical protein